MDSLNEFLSHSTIHGLQFIPRAQSWPVKLCWLGVVLFGFTASAILINNSYSDWRETPVATSITTRPVQELDFPKVTVCPPHGANTALNMDLVRLQKITITEEEKADLINMTEEVFLLGPHKEYQELALAAINPENYRQVLDGFQTYPESYNMIGLEILTNGIQGQLHSPFWGLPTRDSFYNRDRLFHYKVELPEDLLTKLGNGSLVVQLETNTVEAPNWMEEISYVAGSKFRYHNTPLSWMEAEAVCISEGGHLASTLSASELEEAAFLVEENGKTLAWVGATDKEVEGQWKWVDGEAWLLTSWYGNWRNGGKKQNCGFIRSTRDLDDISCGQKKHFICGVQPEIQGNSVNKFVYTKNNLTFNDLQVWWKYNFHNMSVTSAIQNKSMTGFQLKWHLEDSNGDLLTFPLNPKYKGKKEYNNIKKIVNMAKQALESGLTKKALVSTMVTSKLSMIREQDVQSTNPFSKRECDKNVMARCQCSEGQIYQSHFNRVVTRTVMQQLEITLINVNNITDEELEIGLNIYAQLIFCPFQSSEMYLFHTNLIKEKSLGTVFQALMNNLQGVTDPSGVYNLKQFYRQFDSRFHLSLGKTLNVLSTTSNMEKFLAQNVPYFENGPEENNAGKKYDEVSRWQINWPSKRPNLQYKKLTKSSNCHKTSSE